MAVESRKDFRGRFNEFHLEQESGNIGQDSENQCQHGNGVPASIKSVFSVLSEEIIHIQFCLANEDIIRDQNPGNGPQESRVPDQPGKDICATAQELPWENCHSKASRDVSTHFKRNLLRAEVGESVGWGHHICRQIGGKRCHRKSKESHDYRKPSHFLHQCNGIRNGFAKNRYGSGCHRHSNKGEERHSWRQANRLPLDLIFLGCRIACEVRNIERKCRPKPHHGGQLGNKHRPELALFRSTRLKLRRSRKHIPKSIRCAVRPSQKQKSHSNEKRRRIGLQPSNGFRSLGNKPHVHCPKPDEAHELRQVDAEDWESLTLKRIVRYDVQEGVDGEAANPRLNPKPTAGYQPSQHGGNIGSHRSKRGAKQNGKRDSVFGSRMTDQEHGHQDNEVSQKHGSHRLVPVHTGFDHTATEHIGRHADHHPHPKSGNIRPTPIAALSCGRCQVGIVKRWRSPLNHSARNIR